MRSSLSLTSPPVSSVAMSHILAPFHAHKPLENKQVASCSVASFGSDSVLCNISWRHVDLASLFCSFVDFSLISLPQYATQCQHMLHRLLPKGAVWSIL